MGGGVVASIPPWLGTNLGLTFNLSCNVFATRPLPPPTAPVVHMPHRRVHRSSLQGPRTPHRHHRWYVYVY